MDLASAKNPHSDNLAIRAAFPERKEFPLPEIRGRSERAQPRFRGIRNSAFHLLNSPRPVDAKTSELQEIPQEVLALGREDGFGMELDAENRQFPVRETHDLTFLGPGRDFQASRQGVPLHDEGMVPRCLKWAGQSGENIFPIVVDRRGLAVHETVRADDIAAVHLSDALVSEADAKDRDFAAEMPDRFAADSRFRRRAWTRRNHDAFRSERCDFRNRDLVIPPHDDIRSQFAKVLDEVVGERIVVIDDEQHPGKFTRKSGRTQRNIFGSPDTPPSDISGEIPLPAAARSLPPPEISVKLRSGQTIGCSS